jgi:hypothetical protein
MFFEIFGLGQDQRKRWNKSNAYLYNCNYITVHKLLHGSFFFKNLMVHVNL